MDFSISFEPWEEDREKNLQDAQIRLEYVPHRECSPSIEQQWGALPICKAASWIWYGWHDEEHSPYTVFLPHWTSQWWRIFSIDSLCSQASVMKESVPYHFCPHFLSLSISRMGNILHPFIMFPSLPSICNDGKRSLSFLSSFPFKAFAMIEILPILKSSFSSASSLKDREYCSLKDRKNCYPMVWN